MSTYQERMFTVRKRVGSPGEGLLIMDMAQDLLDLGYSHEQVAEGLHLPGEDAIPSVERLRQGLDIVNAWPEDVLDLARQHGAPWHTLYEPAVAWRLEQVEREEMVAFARDTCNTAGRWPYVREWRKVLGKATNRGLPGEGAGQGALL